MKVTIGISVKHIHLTKEDYKLLFDEPIKTLKPINQPGQFSSDKTVTIKNGERRIEHVRLIGPCRNYTQVEISKTDAYYLKLNPPVRKSGDLQGAETITIETPKGQITREACIISARHIHVTPEERIKYNFTKDSYSVKILGEKGGTLDNVIISESEKSYYEMHIDTDDANAFLIKPNEEVEILN